MLSLDSLRSLEMTEGGFPIVQSIRECGDAGEPAALSSRPDGLAFLALAEKVAENLK